MDVHLAHFGACHLFVEMPRGQRMAAMPSSCPAIAARHCRVSCCPVAPLLLQSVRPSLLTPSHSRSPPLTLLLALVVTMRAERYAAAMAARSSCTTAVSATPVLLYLLGPRPAYPHHQAHVLCLSFEHRTLPYMAVAVSVHTDAVAKLA